MPALGCAAKEFATKVGLSSSSVFPASFKALVRTQLARRHALSGRQSPGSSARVCNLHSHRRNVGRVADRPGDGACVDMPIRGVHRVLRRMLVRAVRMLQVAAKKRRGQATAERRRRPLG